MHLIAGIQNAQNEFSHAILIGGTLPKHARAHDVDAGATDAGSKSKPVLDLIAIYGNVMERIVDVPLTSV